MPEIEIRPAVSTDIPSLIALEHYYQSNYVWQMDRSVENGQVSVGFREVRLPRQVKVEYPHQSSWLLTGWNKEPCLLVALFEGQPVGYICLTNQLSGGTAWVRDLVVSEKMRRKGIGTALLLAGSEWAARKGYRRMILEMQSKNYPTIRLAMKLGYEYCGFNDHYFANQDIALFFALYLR